jgi:copper chaperone CopZ
MKKRHNERCKDCKIRVEELLNNIYGKAIVNYNLKLPSKIDDYAGSPFEKQLTQIHLNLQKYRGHKIFVKAKKLPNVDFFIPEPGFIVEFDESQHFTKPREIALSYYSGVLTLGFSKDKWVNLCTTLDKKDNDPAYRDEQRAWYDSLRDFAPEILKIKPTIRLYASDYIWCSLDANNKADQGKFRELIGLRDGYEE